MTTDGLPVVYRGGNKRKAEIRYLSFSSDQDTQTPTGRTHQEPSATTSTKVGGQKIRPSAWDQLSKILPIILFSSRSAKRKARNVETTSTSFKLSKGTVLSSTSIRDDHTDIILEPEDIQRWQIANDLLKSSNQNWQVSGIEAEIGTLRTSTRRTSIGVFSQHLMSPEPSMEACMY